MVNSALHTPFQLLAEDDLGFVYSGSFHDGLTARLIDLSETVLSRSHVTKGNRNKLAFAMVEAYQNIVRHKLNIDLYKKHPQGRPAFIVRSGNNLQSLVAVNAVPNQVRDKIQERIVEINAMDLRDLKRVFLEGLESNAISEKGGAGLGLIEMARRSKNKLGCRMIPLNDEHSLFYLGVVIGDVDDKGIEQVLDTAQAFHQMCIDEDMLILHKGELSASAVSALLPMVQRDMDESPQKASVRSRAYLAGIEVFRTKEKDAIGIFSLCRNGANYTISIGQDLPESSSVQLEQAISEINALTKDQLNSNFRRSLLSHEKKDKEQRGLLDLAICSIGDLISSRDPDVSKTFFTIRAVI